MFSSPIFFQFYIHTIIEIGKIQSFQDHSTLITLALVC
jgi:hypothetical protein